MNIEKLFKLGLENMRDLGELGVVEIKLSPRTYDRIVSDFAATNRAPLIGNQLTLNIAGHSLTLTRSEPYDTL